MIGYITGVAICEQEFNHLDSLPTTPGLLKENNQPWEPLKIDTKLRFRNIEIDPTNPFYPKQSDLKILRLDSTAAIISLKELLVELGIDESQRKEMILYVANSNFIDNSVLNLDSISEVIEKVKQAETGLDKNQLLAAEISPLIPLKTLTNGSESFISQYTKILGENATYGTTNISSVHALEDALNGFKINVGSKALVGGTALANIFSFLNNHQLLNNTDGYSESTASGFIFIETEESTQENNRTVLLEVLRVDYQNIENSVGSNSDWVFYGGSFTEKEHEKLTIKTQVIESKNYFSWFPITGNLGCAELGFLLAAAIKWMKPKETGIIVLEDPYQKCGIVKIRKP
jgi:hypothetical protein